MTSEKPLLRDPEIDPTDDVLKDVLGKNVFSVYSELIHAAVNDYELEPIWRYYKDGGAWLCKVVYKKKTIFWLSVWDKYFTVAFYFTEKTRPGVTELNISDDLKKSMDSTETFGKFIPLTFRITESQQLTDFKEVVQYKKSLK